MKRRTILFLIITLFFSCATSAEKPYIPVEDYIREELSAYYSSGRFFKLYQEIYRYKERFPELTGEMRHKADVQYPLYVQELYEAGDWEEFFTAANNAPLLGITLPYDMNRLRLEYVLNHEKADKNLVLSSEELLNYTAFSDDELYLLENRFQKIVYNEDYPELLSEMEGRGLSWSRDNQVDPSRVLDGTVTVFVNKGINFEDGLGRPDIMVGSGFFIDKKGYLITNYHVIEAMVDPEYEGYSRLYVKLNKSRGEKVPARVVGWDPVLDLALLKVAIEPSYVFSFSKEEEAEIGSHIIAIGSPGGLGSTTTSGIISAVDRPLLGLGGVRQIDVPINPGNSGGPILDDSGLVSNIVFAGIEVFEGVNFAIPVHYLRKVLPSLYKGGLIRHAWMGAALTEQRKRLEVMYVLPGSPAALVGLQKGDIITSVNGVNFRSLIDVQEFIMDYKPGTLMKITVLRQGVNKEFLVCLDERPVKPMLEAHENDTMENLFIPLFGMEIIYSGEVLWNTEYSIGHVYTGSVGDEMGITPNDVIEVVDWELDEEFDAFMLKFIMKSKKAGYLEKSVQIGIPVTVNFFL